MKKQITFSHLVTILFTIPAHKRHFSPFSKCLDWLWVPPDHI